MEKISGSEAIKRMRELKNVPDSYFTMLHLTYNRTKKETKGIRKVEKCRLRAALPTDVFETDSDLYLTYVDLKDDSPRMCFKKLIRFVAFPPNFETLKVNWFDNEL